MQEIRNDGARVFSEGVTSERIKKAVEDPANKEVRVYKDAADFYRAKARHEYALKKRAEKLQRRAERAARERALLAEREKGGE